MKRTIAIAAALALTISLAACAAPAGAEETTVNLRQEAAPGTITVNGKAGLELAPDVAQIRIGVETNGSTPSAARQQNSEAVNATVAAVTALGVEEADIKTDSMNLWNRYDNYGNRSGYRMSTSLTIIVRDIEKAGEVVDAAIEAGSNEMNGIDYLLSNRDQLYSDALSDAVELARQKAETLAALEGRTLGEVMSITEVSDAVATVREMNLNPDVGGADEASMNAKATTIQPGRTSVSAEVSVVFRLQ